MSIAELQRLPPLEKLKIIEALWDGLAQDEASVPMPAWHEKELRETEARHATGQEEAVDWQQAKRELGKRFE